MKYGFYKGYIDDKLKSIEHQLCQYQSDKDPEHLHLIRVDIKKIKSILSCIECVQKGDYPTNTLNPLFRNAGAIRDAQINIELLSKMPRPPGKIIAGIKKQKSKWIRLFMNRIAGFIKSVHSFRAEMDLPNDLPDKNSIKSYFKKKIHKAKKKLHSQERSDLHRFRKIIKELVFVYQSLPGKLQNKVKFDKKCMDIIQKKVGRWHDAHTAVNYLAHQPVSSESDHFISLFKEDEIFLFRRALKQAKGFVHVIGM